MEAVNTNIIGAENITRAAEYANVKKCIMLSTDKAVYPINAMGLSKAMMEKIMIANLEVVRQSSVLLDMEMLWVPEVQLFHCLLTNRKKFTYHNNQ